MRLKISSGKAPTMNSDLRLAETFLILNCASTRLNQGAVFVAEKTGSVTLGMAATVASASEEGLAEASAEISSGISAGGVRSEHRGHQYDYSRVEGVETVRSSN